jgi:hypothetical protein
MQMTLLLFYLHRPSVHCALSTSLACCMRTTSFAPSSPFYTIGPSLASVV